MVVIENMLNKGWWRQRYEKNRHVVSSKGPRKQVQHVSPTLSNMLDQKCWGFLRVMLDDVEPTFFPQKILDENLKQFKHSSNILGISYFLCEFMR